MQQQDTTAAAEPYHCSVADPRAALASTLHAAAERGLIEWQ